jgi:hypothetical protein
MIVVSPTLRAVGLEADLLAQLQAHHAAVVAHQLDRSGGSGSSIALLTAMTLYIRSIR